MIRLLSVLLVAALSVSSFGTVTNYEGNQCPLYVISQKDQTIMPTYGGNNVIGSYYETTRGLWHMSGIFGGHGVYGQTTTMRFDNVVFRYASPASSGSPNWVAPFTMHRAVRHIAPWNYFVNRNGNTNYADTVPGPHFSSTLSFQAPNPLYQNQMTTFDCSTTVISRRMIVDLNYWAKTPTAPPVWVIKEVQPGTIINFDNASTRLPRLTVTWSTNPVGDLDDNGVVNTADVTQFDAWSAAGAYHGYADLDNDGDNDTADRNALLTYVVGTGDVNMDGIVNVGDVNSFQAIVRAGTPFWSSLDSNTNNIMDNPDVIELVTQKLRTVPGDVNGDCYVNATDYNIANGNLFDVNKFWTDGDVNNSTSVDVVDLNIITSYLNEAGDCSQ